VGEWYVIFTKTGEEGKLGKILEIFFCKKELKILIPRRKIIERKEKQKTEKIKLLFPGYVFIKTKMCNEVYNRINNIYKFAKLLKEESEPAVVREAEMRIILSLTGNSDLIGFSKGIDVGGRIKIIDGPLKGYEGLIEKIDRRKNRAKIRLNVIGDCRLIDVGIHIIDTDDNKILNDVS
jgi:transcriptional antiterminator NusG